MSATLSELLTHAAMMSDWEIAKDFNDCLLPVAASAQDAAVLKEYANARRRAGDFSPGKPGANNHRTVSETDYLDSGRICEMEDCGRPIRTHNAQAKYCSNKCRVRAQRTGLVVESGKADLLAQNASDSGHRTLRKDST